MFSKRLPKFLLIIVVLLFLALLDPSVALGVQQANKPEPDQPVPLSADSILGPEFQISIPVTNPGENWFQPAAAYNSKQDEYLVVMHNDLSDGKSIYGSIFNGRGVKKITTWIAMVNNKDNVQPAVVYNRINNEYLIVWMFNQNGDGYTYEIWGRILPADGEILPSNNTFMIAKVSNYSLLSPRIAWNSYRNEYLVVWNTFDVSAGVPGIPHDISGYRLSSSGAVINPGTPLLLTSSTYPHQADLAYNVAMDQYMLVFVRIYMSSATGNDVYGMRVDWQGTAVNPPGVFPIANTSKHENHPVIATNCQNRYIVVWQYEYSGVDNDIYAREIDIIGNLIGSTSTLITNTVYDEVNPAVAAMPGNMTNYIAVWQKSGDFESEGIWAKYWKPGGSSQTFEVASFAFWKNEMPALAFGGPGFLFAYEGAPPIGYRHIYGRFWSPETVYLPLVMR